MTNEPPGPSSPSDSDEKFPVRVLRGRVRALVLQIAAEARAEWAYTSDVIGRAFRTHRELGSSERRQVSETVYGLVRWHRRLEAIVDELVPSGLSAEARDDLLLLTYEARQGADPAAISAEVQRLLEPGSARAAARPRAGLRAEAIAARLAAEEAGLGAARGVDREALRLSFPTWMLDRLVGDFGEQEAFALAEALNRRAPMTVRANGARIDRDALAARLREEKVLTRPTPLSPTGLIFETRVNAFGLQAFRDGLFEVMDEGSQLVAEVVAPPPRGRVVDACAGAGGKTLALAALLQGQGRVLALDVAGKKLEELRRRARRAGLSSVMAREIEPGRPPPPEARAGGWDRVLVDAPCSGVGTLRRNPEARWRLRPHDLDAFPPRQLALMVDYAPLCAVGGRLIYATCTVLAAENERVVERFCAERPDFSPMPLKEILGKERALALGDGVNLRLYPHRHDTDGFFAAVLRRTR
jgi:16S rRNA (cytosine967-C5)-methyltransferase